MRRSRLYLCLSVLMLAVGVGASHFSDGCPLRRGNCSHKQQRHQVDYQRLYQYAISGNDAAAVAVAEKLLAKKPGEREVLLYYGYALRGAGRHHDAEAAYTNAIEPAKGNNAETWVLIDAYTGRAAARIAQGDIAGADRDLSRAMEYANRAEHRNRSQRSAYQLACVHAQLSVVYESLKGRHTAELERSRAVDWLNKALQRGYDNEQHMRADRDLDPIKAYPGYLALFE